MAGEYNGERFGSILPSSQINAVDNLAKRIQEERELEIDRQKYAQQLAQREAAEDDALSEYAQKQTNGLITKLDRSNPYNAILTTEIYDLKKQVIDFIAKGGANNAEVDGLINSGAAEIMDLNSRWNSLNATIQQNSQSVKALGLDPKEVAAKARELAFYSKDEKTGKLFLDKDKLKNIDPSYDPVQDVYKNHADELSPVKPFSKITWTKVSPSADRKDVYDSQTGDLLATGTFMNYIPGLHKPGLKNGKPYIGKVGEVQLVDKDEYGNETPLTHTVKVINPKTGKEEKRRVPLMGIDDESYVSLIANNPTLEVYANQKLSAERKKKNGTGITRLY